MGDYFFTSEELIKSIQRRASIPSNQSLMSDEDILDFADEEMRMNVLPLLLSTNEDFYLYREEVPLVSGQVNYPIPYRAIGSKLREVGFSEDANSYRPLNRISIDHIGYTNQSKGTQLNHFYLQGDKVVLYADSQLSGNLVFFYPLRPNRLVLPNQVAIIENITEAGVITIKDISGRKNPTNFTDGIEYDFIKTKSNHGILDFDKVAIDVTSDSSTDEVISMTFDPSDIPSDLVPGDRIALSGETDIVPCTTELQPMLAQTVAARVLESIGDLENLNAANQKLSKMEQASLILTENRVEGSPIKIVRRNGLLRNGSRRRFGGRGL